jgi:hypothetical protein
MGSARNDYWVFALSDHVSDQSATQPRRRLISSMSGRSDDITAPSANPDDRRVRQDRDLMDVTKRRG